MAKKVILCIDDDPETIKLVRLILARRNYEVKSATGGQEGLLMAERLQPDLILLDVMMPDVDGWQVLEKLRATEATRKLRVVLFSALHMMTPQKIEGYIAKPFSPQQLVEQVQRALDD